jgi:hypothetical protein
MDFLWQPIADCRLICGSENSFLRPLHREIATLVEAWRLSLGSKDERLDEKEVGRRIDRFRDRNEDVAALIDSNPFKLILHFLDTSPGKSFCEGLGEANDRSLSGNCSRQVNEAGSAGVP